MLIPILLIAQPKCSFEHFSTSNGLVDNRVMCITKDRDGFMWMGTWTGLNRFDGHNFVTYKSHPGDWSELKNNRIDFIVEDNAGFLWMKAYDQQVYRFDKRTEQFLSVLKPTKTGKPQVGIDKIIVLQNNKLALTTKNQGIFLISETASGKPTNTWFSKEMDVSTRLPSDSIHCFYQDSSSTIWIGSPHGLTCLQASKDGIYKKKDVAGELKNVDITCIAENTTSLWFGTANGKLFILDKITQKLSFLHASLGKINNIKISKIKPSLLYASTSLGELLTISLDSNKVISANNFSDGELLSLYEDHNGLLWIEPKANGVVQFNPKTKIFQLFTQPNYSNYIHDADEYKVVEDNMGIVWINMKGAGFGYFDSATNTVKYFFNEPGNANHRFSNMVSAQYLDLDGILWLSTIDGGIEKIVFQPNDFTQTLMLNNSFFKADNEVRGICMDNKDRLWVATKSKKVYVSGDGNAVNKLFINFPALTAGVYTILEDTKGNIWLGTKGDGLFKASPLDTTRKRYSIKHYITDANNPYSISNDLIYSLIEDKSGRIWIGTYGGGINLIEETGSDTKFYHHKNLFHTYPRNTCDKVRHLATDADGKIWIGTTEGLLIFDPNHPNFFASNFVRHGKIPGNKESLGDNDVQFIYRDKGNKMWVLTSSGGLNKAIGNNPMQSLAFSNYSKKNGLPSDYLFSCIEDTKGFLWIATQNGLSRFNQLNNSFQNFDAADGLPQVAFAEAACVSTKSGELIFGTVNGILRFNPANIINPTINANIAFTNLQINNEDIFPNSKSPILQYAVNSSKEITLAYHQNTVSIDYAVLDYRSEGKESYEYRLMGFDSVWQDNKSSRKATYTNLPPGEYTFQVKSTSTDLYSNIPIKSIDITILPPPWKTWWAYLIYLTLASLLLALVRKNAITMLKLRQNIIIERKLANLKIDFFTNISHELRTPLTLILNPLEEIAKKEKLSEEGNRHLIIVRKNAKRMTRFINQLLDLRKAQSGQAKLRVSKVELVAFIQRITSYFADAAHQKNIALTVKPEFEQIFVWIDAEKIDVVMYNILANALKFTAAGNDITIKIGYSKLSGNIVIETTDEGIGVPIHEIDEIFNLYFTGQKPEGSDLKGTGIGLALSKELVLLHEGKISAKNNFPHGLVVTLELKPGKDHFRKDKIIFVEANNAIENDLRQEMLPDEETETTSPILDDTNNLPKLLLVEDNNDLRSFLKTQLSGLFKVETAQNGKEGLEKASAIFPDIILSDVMMPIMNGIEMLDKLKNNPETSHIPIVLLSAKFSIESQIEGLKYGADHYIAKPFQNDFLIASLNNLLAQRKRLFQALLKDDDKKEIEINPTPITITSHDENFLQKVISIVEEKMTDVQFNIDVVADNMNMSRSPFYRKLKSLTGLSPVEFVKEIRLKRSIQYLDAGEHNISVIAFEVGFNTTKYFSSCFKQRFGQTPSEYIKGNLKNAD